MGVEELEGHDFAFVHQVSFHMVILGCLSIYQVLNLFRAPTSSRLNVQWISAITHLININAIQLYER